LPVLRTGKHSKFGNFLGMAEPLPLKNFCLKPY
jgi:hypothetical protein